MVSLPNCLAKASGKCAFKVIERLLPDHGTSFRVWNGLQIRSILWHFAMVVALQDKCPWEHAGTMNIGWDWGDIRTLSSPRLPSKWLGCRIFCNGSCFFPSTNPLSLDREFLTRPQRWSFAFWRPSVTGEPRGDSGQPTDPARLSQ
jgi:hypothetical protein